jgi:hypothetical protein
VIDIAGNRKNHRVFKLSEIAADVSYVRLETRPDVLIGYGSIKPAGKYFVVGTFKKPIMLFSNDGKYIRSIGSVGKGPGEYKNPAINQIDSIREELFVISSGMDRICRYSFSGKLLQDIPLPQSCTDFYRFNNGNLLLATPDNYRPDGFYPLVLLDPKGKPIREIKTSEAPAGKQIAYGVRPNFESGCNGWAIVTNSGRDVIWQISPDGEIKPYASLLLGKLKTPDEFYYDPQSKKLFLRDSTGVGEFGFLNDLNDGTCFGATQYFKQGNWLFTDLMAVDLKQSQSSYARRDAINNDNKKAMMKMIDSQDEGDNPVIMIVKLRPEGAPNLRL